MYNLDECQFLKGISITNSSPWNLSCNI